MIEKLKKISQGIFCVGISTLPVNSCKEPLISSRTTGSPQVHAEHTDTKIDLYGAVSTTYAHVLGVPEIQVLGNGQGGSSSEVIFGASGSDQINGLGGHDFILGGAGIDMLVGGSGNDTIYAGKHGDTVHGGQGNDICYGDRGTDVIYGDRDHDYLVGGCGNDVLHGGSGDDTYVYRRTDGIDVIYETEGQDTLRCLGFLPGELTRIRDGGDLLIRSPFGELRIREHFVSPGRQVETILCH